MAKPDDNATVVFICNDAELPQYTAIAQQLADSLQAELSAISFSHVHVSEEFQVSTVIESLLAGRTVSVSYTHLTLPTKA